MICSPSDFLCGILNSVFVVGVCLVRKADEVCAAALLEDMAKTLTGVLSGLNLVTVRRFLFVFLSETEASTTTETFALVENSPCLSEVLRN